MMADQKVTLDAAGCLGRVLTLLGFIWIGIVVLGGMGLLSELGFSRGFLAGIGGTILPGLMLLVAGRSVSRRAAKTRARTIGAPEGPTPPVIQPKRVPTIRSEPAQKAPIPFRVEETLSPKPVVEPAPRAEPAPEKPTETQEVLEEVFSKLKEPSAFTTSGRSRPKTSQEMIEEARKRWGTGKPP